MNFLAKVASGLGSTFGSLQAGYRKSVSLSAWAEQWKRGSDTEGEVAGRREAFTRPYAQSAWVSAAVNLIANEIAGRPVRFYAGDQEYDEARLAAFWAAPALGPRVAFGVQPRLTLSQVLFDLAAWERLEGEFFLVLDESWLLAGARRADLPPFLIAHPQRMQAVLLAGMLQGWRYTDAGGRQYIFLPEQVIHHRSFNPYDDWRGLGRLQAARVAAEGAFLTGTYIRNLARNNGDQGFIVVGKNGPATDPQREQIELALRAKRRALAAGVAKDLFISGGDIAIERPQEQAASSEIITSQAVSHEEVFIAFEVPPSMSAVKASYSIGKDSDRYALITGPCQAIGSKIGGAFGAIASRQAGQVLTAELEWDDHPVMIEVRNSRLDSALKLWGVGMPLSAANDYLGLGMKPFAGWDVGYLPFSVSPVGQLETSNAKPETDPALAESDTPSDPAVEQLRLLVLARAKAQQTKRQCINVTPKAGERDPLSMFVCACDAGAGVALKDRDPKELAQWRTITLRKREMFLQYQARLGRELMAARAEVLRNIQAKYTPPVKSAAGELPAVAKAAVSHLLFDLAKFAEGMLGAMRKQSAVALQSAGEDLYKEIGRDDPFKYPAEAVLEFTRSRENYIQGASAAIHGRIKETLEEGYTAGDTQDELTSRVQAAFNDISKGQARRIASTETGVVYNAGRDEAMQSAGVQYKKWLTSGNANVRATHAAANGQVVAIDEPFEVGDSQLMFPGDDSLGAPAEEVINCHCVQVAVASAPGGAA